MHKNIYSQQTGFTLIELLLYMVLVGIILSATTSFFIITADSRVKSQSVNEVEQQGVQVMNYILQSIRNAEGISAPTIGVTATQLTLTSQTSTLNPTVINLNGTVIETKESTAATVPLTTDEVQASSLSFKNLSRPSTPGTVQVSFTLSRTNPANKNIYKYQKTFISTGTIRQ